MSTTRRRLIQVGVIGAVALAIGGVGVALQGTDIRQPARPLLALSPRSFSILAAVADRLVVVPGGPSARQAQVAEGVDALLATLHPDTTVEFEQALTLLENAAAGLLIDQRWTTFTGSPPDVQDRVLKGWSESRFSLLRKVFRAVHGLCMGVYWTQDELHGLIGYPGPPDLSALAPPEPVAEPPEPSVLEPVTVEAP